MRLRSSCLMNESLRHDRIWGLSIAYNELWVPCTEAPFIASFISDLWKAANASSSSRIRVIISSAGPAPTATATTRCGSRSSARRHWSSCCRPKNGRTSSTAMTGPPGCCPCCSTTSTSTVECTPSGSASRCTISATRVRSDRGALGDGPGRPEHYFHYDRLRDNLNHGQLNLAKAGIVYSNFVTTVSNRHRWEAASTDQNFGLGHTLWRARRQVRRRAQRCRL